MPHADSQLNRRLARTARGNVPDLSPHCFFGRAFWRAPGYGRVRPHLHPRKKASMRLCATPTGAALGCGLLCVLYVGVLYVGGSRDRERSKPEVIRKRIVRVLAVSAASPLLLACYPCPGAADGHPDLPWLAWVGLPGVGVSLLASCCALILTAWLYLGPLLLTPMGDWPLIVEDKVAPTLPNLRAMVVVRRVRHGALGDGRMMMSSPLLPGRAR